MKSLRDIDNFLKCLIVQMDKFYDNRDPEKSRLSVG